MSEDAHQRAEDALATAQTAMQRCTDLEQRCSQLEETVGDQQDAIRLLRSQLRDGEKPGRSAPDAPDRRDQEIIDRLTPGQTISIEHLRDLYRRHTDIRSEKTLTQRTKALVARDEFEVTDIGKITYKREVAP